MPTELMIYQVDAFADAVFRGNPAAVVPLDAWLPDVVMQEIAAENNLAETAFIVPEDEGYAIRWFTPTVEIELCGHATLASAYVITKFLHPGRRKMLFSTQKAGMLIVTETHGMLALDFPARPPKPIAAPDGFEAALGAPAETLLAANTLVCVFPTAADVAALQPDFRKIAALPFHAVIATAPGEDGVDFVSRFFAPAAGIDEDPVTGSAHCLLIPYWAERLDRSRLEARQISRRGGRLLCEACGDRVTMAGEAKLYMDGRIYLP